MSTTNKIASIELGRVIAMLAILSMHCQLFLGYLEFNGESWFGYVFNQSTRFAVPLFFLISGYLIQPKLTLDPIGTLKSYSMPLVKIWVVWSILSLVMPFNWGTLLSEGYLAERSGYWNYLLQSPLNSLLEGGLVHLWFIPALVCAVALLAFLIKSKQSALIMPIAILLYFYGALAGSYQVITHFDAPFFTRNGPFFATLMVAIGFKIRQSQYSLNSKSALLIAVVGLALHMGEAWNLHQYGQAFNANDYLLGTGIWAIGCFLWLLSKPTLGDSTLVFSLSKRVLPIYVSHMLVIIFMLNIAGMLELTHGVRDLVVWSGSVLLTYLLVLGLEKTPFNTLLFR
ncbi:acyltransferase [Vibrio genomosp. F10]|uniref:Fucose 4-O-acetylase n=1 Tax=Vibrio genomosp. F10 TaxID=723171 RepID=A0A1B9R0V3_9VIBR|nr:acyltransferase family protein [Vibrio genomosp. F10]OCH77919.1 fucose 4-O-acetylase [Vibrio genomosp. F10]